ncbi:thiol peroxidase [Myxococcus sp. K38C18041901]|uniref:thiol peroxidase n=1 Tax=Myxococcus guangdongensis TaxID=2906760 RepID=UPI0020A73EF7|nr:thiol peroxidase [Myxococcus guangdongensis]MCP3059540.1 thiol peroxidase [Myxococcus guangdongensis]
MAEFKDQVTYRGKPVTLEGDRQVQVGDLAPDFTVYKGFYESHRLSELKGQVVVLSVAPSVDTKVCAIQLRMFNQQATQLGPDVKVWYLSLDLPFALNRFSAAEGIQNVAVLSDYKDRDFARKYGLYMKELGLLARSTFVVDREGRVVFREVVPEMMHEPDYDAALEAVRKAL